MVGRSWLKDEEGGRRGDWERHKVKTGGGGAPGSVRE